LGCSCGGGLGGGGIRGPFLAQLLDGGGPPGTGFVVRDAERDAELLRVLRHAPIRLELADDLLEGRPVRGTAEGVRPAARRCPDQILGRRDLGRVAARLAAAAAPSPATLSTGGFLGLIGGRGTFRRRSLLGRGLGTRGRRAGVS
jgi:hypothetical protein